MTAERYEALVAPLRRHPGAVRALKGIDRSLTALCYALYPVLLLYLWYTGDGRFLRCFLVPAISFAAVSIFRSVYNAPRPYEQEGFDPLIKKKTKGHSFPSRHVFSAFTIALAYLYVFPAAGGTLLLLGVFLALVRVVGGVHFPKDVIAGAVIALVVGGLGYFLM